MGRSEIGVEEGWECWETAAGKVRVTSSDFGGGIFSTPIRGTNICSTWIIDRGKGRGREGPNWSVDVEVKYGINSKKEISTETILSRY